MVQLYGIFKLEKSCLKTCHIVDTMYFACFRLLVIFIDFVHLRLSRQTCALKGRQICVGLV